MSSASARIFSLISTPFPLRHIHHSRPSLLFLSSPRLFFPSLSPPPRSSFHLPRRFHFNAHAQTSTDEQFNDYLPPPSSVNGAGGSSPWPEWYKLINSFQFSRYSSPIHTISGSDNIVDDGAGLPGDFVKSANACLAFAREHEGLLWSLSRKDIEIIVDNGPPFLFKDFVDAMRRMKLFLSGNTNDVLGSEKPTTVDLMKFLLSYASTALVSSETNHFNNKEIVEESVKRLFSELAEISGAPESALPGSSAQVSRSFGQHVEVKRGDWICPRCRFMNFARNMNCLECDEARPKRQLTGGEWECPQCDFFNYGRNSLCLRCDCQKPGMSTPIPGSGYNYTSNHESSNKQSAQNQERVQSWYHKITQLENRANEGNTSADVDTAITTAFKKGVLSESNALKQGDNESLDVKISQRFDKILGRSTDASGVNNWISNTTGNIGSRIPESSPPSYENFPENMPMSKGENRFVVREKKDRSLTSPLYKRQMAMEQSRGNNYVPFFPFPPDYFSKGKQPIKEESPAVTYDQHPSDQSRAEPTLNQQTSAMSSNQRSADISTQKTQDYMQQTQNFQGFSNENYWAPANEPKTYSKATNQQADDQKVTGLWRGSSLEGSAVKEPDPLDMSEEAKAERWFRRVAQIKDIKELSEIPDEDFPSIMPMRKGVNRFVVSKRKTPLERRLATSQYKRNLPIVKSDPVNDNDANES